MSTPYSLVSPDYDYTSGGIKVMWGLFGWLLAKGQIAYMNRRPYGKVIGIYPEIINGNPAEADTIVRYILQKPGMMTTNGTPGPTVFDPTDKVYYFSKLFGEAKDESHYMFLPSIDLHTFKDQKRKRTKTAVFYGKGKGPALKPDQILIDRNIASDQQALADLLNECEVVYCYDPVSAMLEVARLCGTRIVMFPTTYSKDDFARYEPGTNGISWGRDEEVPLDVKGFRDHYINLRSQFTQKLDRFIEETQSEL